MILFIAEVFLKTFLARLSLIGKTEDQRLLVKQNWAKMVLAHFGFTLEIHGTQPIDTNFILVGNHISFLDIPVLMSALPQAIFIAKDDMKKWPIIGSGAAAAGTIFVNRKNGSSSNVIQKISEILTVKNKIITVFPSGTTSLHEQKPWKKGIFNIAKKNNMPIQLFRIDYAPLRESAYIDDDHLLKQIAGLKKLKNKKVTLTWLDRYAEIEKPQEFAETLRKKVSENNL